MLTALYLKAVPPTKKAPSSCDHVIGLRDSHPSHGAHVPPPSLGGRRARFASTREGHRNGVDATVQERDRKRETSASHLDGKIPPIPEIRMESPRQSALAPPRLTICKWAPSGLVGFNPE